MRRLNKLLEEAERSLPAGDEPSAAPDAGQRLPPPLPPVPRASPPRAASPAPLVANPSAAPAAPQAIRAQSPPPLHNRSPCALTAANGVEASAATAGAASHRGGSPPSFRDLLGAV